MIDTPMLAHPSTGAGGRRIYTVEELVARGWTLDLKVDGVRAFGRYGRLVNRENVDIAARFPEISVPDNHWLDGEIVALDGSFETTLIRDKQVTPAKIKKLAESHPCQFVAFDILNDTIDGRPSYAHRRAMLESKASKHGWTITPTGGDMGFFHHTRDLEMEGVIAKRPTSTYQFGRRSKDWIKFKHLHRITMVAVGYDLGNGARSHFGAMKLALIGPEGATRGPGDGWRVGTGFSDKEILDLKRRLDAGELFAVEIEVLNRTKDGALRFPAYKGIRSDVPVHTCLVDQVDGLPTC